MADKNIGASDPRRFHNGGLLIISDGTDNFTVKKIRSGTARCRDGRRSIAYAADQGAQLRPRLGDKQYSSIELDVEFTDEHGTDSLQDLMSLAAVTDGNVPEYTVTIIWLDDLDETAGIQVTYALSHFSESFSIEGTADGEHGDTVPIRMMSRTEEGVWADYTAA